MTNHRPLGVLVVDDEHAILNLLDVVLKNAGFDTRLADNGADAVKLYRAQASVIDVVLLDVNISGGLDGPETAAALKAVDQDVRFYFMTGNPGAYTVDQLLACGASRVFEKPLPLAELVDVLRSLSQQADR